MQLCTLGDLIIMSAATPGVCGPHTRLQPSRWVRARIQAVRYPDPIYPTVSPIGLSDELVE
jgi:hypothetical protein